MTPLERILLAATGILVCVPAVHAQRPFRAHPGPTAGLSYYGTAVTGLGDIGTDNVPDYAISSPRDSTGGNAAGAVRAYSGSTGLVLWTATGSGGWPVCNGPGTNGDFFGWSMVRIPDQTGDGVEELAVGSPNRGVVNGNCTDPFYGRVTVLNGATGAVVSTADGTAKQDLFGYDIARIPSVNLDPVDEYVVIAPGKYAQVFDGNTGSKLDYIGLNQGESVVCAAGDLNFDGWVWEVAFGNPSSAQVRIWGIGGFGTLGTFQGSVGGRFGASLEYAPGHGVLAGAPGEAGNSGAVYLIQSLGGGGGGNPPPAPLTLSAGMPNDRLGESIAYGGIAGMGAQPDVLVGAIGGDYARLMAIDGTLIQDVIGTSSAAFGASVAWVGDIVGNGFDEFLVGDPEATMFAGHADLFYGGPAATLNQSFGPGCNPSGGVPVLTQTAPIIPGLTFNLALASAPAGASGLLYIGLADSQGFVVPPCTVWMNPAVGPFVAAPIFTTAGGAWTGPGFATPLDPALVGLTFAHQAVVDDNGTPAFSNATASRVGW